MVMEPGLIGRDAEIAAIRGFLSAGNTGPTALVITGDAGIGKTAVWRHVVEAARRSSRVLSCQPASAERPLAFTALDDLLGSVIEDIVPALPGPRRIAVETALLRDAPLPLSPTGRLRAGYAQPERRILARGVLDVLRILAGGASLMIAVDDTQWLDPPSAAVLEFCLRRLDGVPVSIVLTFRTDDPVLLGLDRTLPPDHLRRVQLGPLTLGAIGEILRSRLDAGLPRHALTRLYDACGGNPFYALEWARALLDMPSLSVTNEPIPIPRGLGALVQRRVRRLSSESRRAGWLVAASSDPRERKICAALGDAESWAAVDQAVADGIMERVGDTLRFTHPLLRSALYAEMTPDVRREMHRRLAATADDPEERAWHLALGVDRPTESVAAVLGAAARHAAARGAPQAAAALAEQAARQTPASRADMAGERTVWAADYQFRAGDITRSRELIQSVLAANPSGPRRAPLLLRLATIHYHQNGWPPAERAFRQAAEDAADDPALRAHAEQELGFARLVAGDLPGASGWAEASLRSATQAADPRLVAHSLARVALFEFLRGNGMRTDLLDRAEALDASAGEEPVGWLPMLDPGLVIGMILKWCDRLDEARLRLADRYRHALDRGDEASLPFVLYHFSQLECWAGNWAVAEQYALEACRVADETRQRPMRPAALYSLALVRAHLGRADDARGIAEEALALCDRTGNVPLTSLVVAVLGFVALSLEDHEAAHAHLGRLADAAAAVGLGEPGVVRFLPDEIEALAALGEIDLAWSLARKLEKQGRLLGRPWALATSARCQARLAGMDGDIERARECCARALSRHARLPMPFELGRTLLVHGTVERRARHKSVARESLGQALDIFERLGAPLWAGKVRRELAKIATRVPQDGLTETEQRVASLVARGQTNREVASAMFVTTNTVQTHVQHILRKLGVRSRTELAARLLPGQPSEYH